MDFHSDQGASMSSINFKKIFIFLLICIPSIALAGDIDVVIKLERIQVLEPSEEGGDEIYFSISTFGQKVEPTFTRVPMFPIYWMSKHISKVKNVELWKGKLTEGASKQVVLSLVEQDIPPWNIDDHLGSVKVKLVNDKGTFRKTWSMPNYKDQTEVHQINKDSFNPTFKFKGSGGVYKASFKIEIKEK